MKVRLIIKVPKTSQTGPDTWQDVTEYRTHELDAPPELEAILSIHSDTVIIGAEVARQQETQNDNTTE